MPLFLKLQMNRWGCWKRFLYHWIINKDAKELIYYMRMVIDPRCGRKTKHDHAEILTYLVVGYLAGRDSVRRCLKWCENHIDFLRQHLELKNGIASPATVSRILGSLWRFHKKWNCQKTTDHGWRQPYRWHSSGGIDFQ